MFIPDPGSDFFLSRIPDPNCLHPGSRIRIKFNPKKPKKWFLSSRKYDPGCSSRIPDPDADFLPIPDPGVKKAPDPGSGSATLAESINKRIFATVHPGLFFCEVRKYYWKLKSQKNTNAKTCRSTSRACGAQITE